MEKERRIKVLSMVALIVAVLGLTVAFASLSQTLTINGTASVNAAEWDVHFEKSSTESEITGSAVLSNTPELTGTTISNLNMSVTKPGDYITYYFDIVNNGTIDAVLNNDVKGGNLLYDDFNACYNVSPMTDECKKFDFNSDGFINTSDSTFFTSSWIEYAIYDVETGEAIKKGETIIPNKTTKSYMLVFGIKEDSSYITSEGWTIEDTINLEFVQN